MVKSAASAVMLVALIVLVTSAVAIALRAYGLARHLHRLAQRGLSHVRIHA